MRDRVSLKRAEEIEFATNTPRETSGEMEGKKRIMEPMDVLQKPPAASLISYGKSITLSDPRD
jgi:hypothetical protein